MASKGKDFIYILAQQYNLECQIIIIDISEYDRYNINQYINFVSFSQNLLTLKGFNDNYAKIIGSFGGRQQEFIIDPKECPQYCSSCYNKETCFSCEEDNINRDLNNLCKCKDGYYQDPQNSSCLKCNQNCKTCSDDKSCLTCPGQYQNALNLCKCADGFEIYKPQNVCQVIGYSPPCLKNQFKDYYTKICYECYLYKGACFKECPIYENLNLFYVQKEIILTQKDGKNICVEQIKPLCKIIMIISASSLGLILIGTGSVLVYTLTCQQISNETILVNNPIVKTSLTNTNVKNEVLLAFIYEENENYQIKLIFITSDGQFTRNSQDFQVPLQKYCFGLRSTTGKNVIYVLLQQEDFFSLNLIDIKDEASFNLKEPIIMEKYEGIYNLFSIKAFSDDYSFIWMRNNENTLQQTSIDPEECPQYCESCMNSDDCLTCLEPVSLRNVNNQCNANQGYYTDPNDDLKVQKCNPQCRTCSDGKSCITCNGNYRDETNFCKCLPGFEEYKETQQCQVIGYSPPCKQNQQKDIETKLCFDCYYYKGYCFKECPSYENDNIFNTQKEIKLLLLEGKNICQLQTTKTQKLINIILLIISALIIIISGILCTYENTCYERNQSFNDLIQLQDNHKIVPRQDVQQKIAQNNNNHQNQEQIYPDNQIQNISIVSHENQHNQEFTQSMQLNKL
ncbi:Insulin-like growth factor binding protein, N-terminal [Pseudocohnilembus persalinus]|uniref:Insulin-like growth factor binding protein, N-terminal n=1 Tax=Pseudocohnilembus persalinus TaxID=266149 RepID=A0A0V0R5Q2_PSEPJ|nr:Insulin-like growth factor binding protein, N-terminal [Pseudocohnilembus persalinus]|eukprot:KRX09801.1 Insulin-like growth factor binding protein, N-terminal [Pseudocohnilembus persalinus]